MRTYAQQMFFTQTLPIIIVIVVAAFFIIKNMKK